MTSRATAPHRRRWLVAVAVVFGISVLLGWQEHVRRVRAQTLAHELQLKGGQVYGDTTLFELVQRWWDGNPVNWKAGRLVTLFDVRLDSAWLRDHDDLVELQIAYLYLGRSTVTTDDAVRIIGRHPLQTYGARGQHDADTVAAALADCSRLKQVEFRESDLTDAGLRSLPLEQLQGLYIEETQVTPDGVCELRRCRDLMFLSLGGQQLDERMAKVLAGLPALHHVTLVGPSVRDDNVQCIVTLQKLPFLQLRATSVTETGREMLDAAMPSTVIGREST